MISRRFGFAACLEKRLLLVDGNYYVYRSFYAIRNLSNSRGEPTNAIYGFVKALRKMVQDLRPTHAAVAWDEGLPVRRTTLQPAYKAQRPDMPELMRPQIEILRGLTPHMGFVGLGCPNTEADDLMATYTRLAQPTGMEVILATNDKDLMQLVGPGVSVYSTNKSDLRTPGDPFALLGTEEVTERWGVRPEQIGDVLALTGDAVDNIPGISGVGAKTAARWIRARGSLDALLADLESIGNPRVRETLRTGMQQIADNREMVRLDDDLPPPVALEGLLMKHDPPALIAILRQCEFKSLLAEVEKENSVQGLLL